MRNESDKVQYKWGAILLLKYGIKYGEKASDKSWRHAMCAHKAQDKEQRKREVEEPRIEHDSLTARRASALTKVR